MKYRIGVVVRFKKDPDSWESGNEATVTKINRDGSYWVRSEATGEEYHVDATDLVALKMKRK